MRDTPEAIDGGRLITEEQPVVHPDIPKVTTSKRLQITEADLDLPVVAAATAPPIAPAAPAWQPASGPPPLLRPPAAPRPPAPTAPPPVSAPPVSSHALAAMALDHKSSGAAILLSLLFTGAGQWYCGHVLRGFGFLGLAIFCAVLCFVLIGFILLPIVWLWAAIDAGALANRHNARLLTQVTGR